MALKDNQGFTLLEVMISLAIFGMTATVLLGLRNWDIDTRMFSQNVTIATLLVQEKLVEAELAVDGPPAFGVSTGDFGDRAPGFFWRQTVSATPLTIDVREVKARVSWGQGNEEENFVLSSGSDEETETADAVEAVAYYLFEQ
ncbi:MAG: hypothetical protein CMH81_02405 [Nitrospiraceae bacterium]|jgi:type II secretion system protein I|nr:hypothetical protein [Nitrospiraceae bacterium]|tara:strand:+ start:419 stop:847 length:429 start_codon:yes stop_codon:yes gene_type:complete